MRSSDSRWRFPSLATVALLAGSGYLLSLATDRDYTRSLRVRLVYLTAGAASVLALVPGPWRRATLGAAVGLIGLSALFVASKILWPDNGRWDFGPLAKAVAAVLSVAPLLAVAAVALAFRRALPRSPAPPDPCPGGPP